MACFTLPSISFEVDYNDPLVCECMEWLKSCLHNNKQSDIWDATLMGYVIIKYGLKHLIDCKRQRIDDSQVRNDVQKVFEHQIIIKDIEREAIERKLQLECNLLRTELDNARGHIDKETHFLNEKITLLSNHAQELKSTLSIREDEIKALNEKLVQNYKNEEIKRLHQEITQRDMYIAQLKNSNFCKGIIGENIVKDILSKTFPDYAILDKSGTTAESDIHFVNKNDEIIAVECKYKEQITLQDVDKTIRDVSYLQQKYGNKFIGYIFYSLKSVNIPKKGFTFEIINNIPVLWYGTRLEDNPKLNDDIVFIAKIAQTLAVLLKNGKNDIDDIGSMLNNNLEKISQNKKWLATLMDALNSASANVKKINDNNNIIYQTTFDYMQARGMVQFTLPDQHTCEQCCRTFKRKCDLTKHRCTT